MVKHRNSSCPTIFGYLRYFTECDLDRRASDDRCCGWPDPTRGQDEPALAVKCIHRGESSVRKPYPRLLSSKPPCLKTCEFTAANSLPDALSFTMLASVDPRRRNRAQRHKQRTC